MAEQPRNNTEKTYYNRLKSFGNAVFPLIITDILVAAWVARTPVTVTEIQAELTDRGFPASRQSITAHLDNIVTALEHPAWELHRTEKRVGKTKAAAFYIQFKTERKDI